MDSNTKFTDVVRFQDDSEFNRTPKGDMEAYDNGYALWAFAEAWKGGELTTQPPTLKDINAYDFTYYGVNGYLSYNQLFQQLDAWCSTNYGSSLDLRFPELASFFHNVANKWYIDTGLSTEDVPTMDYFDQLNGYDTSFLNPKVYNITPPFFYNYSHVINVGVGAVYISNDVLVPLQRRGIHGDFYLIDTYPNILTPSHSLNMYRMLQILLAHLSYEGTLGEEPSRNIAVDFNIIKKCLFSASPKLVYWNPEDIATSRGIRTKTPSGLDNEFNPVLLDRVLDYIKYIESELKLAQQNARKKRRKS